MWLYPPEYQAPMQRAHAHRAMLLPYRYTLAAIAHESAVCPQRPMADTPAGLPTLQRQ